MRDLALILERILKKGRKEYEVCVLNKSNSVTVRLVFDLVEIRQSEMFKI